MRKIISLLLALTILFMLCACGSSSSTLSGKYYWEDASGVYYEFDGNDNCYLVNEGVGKVSYLYVYNEDETYEGLDGIYVVHISDVNSNCTHKLVYDSNENTVWDPDLGIFSKK